MFFRLCQSLRRRGQDERGFTMVELMAVLIIIAVLIAGGLAFYLKYIDNSKVVKAQGQMSTMAAALDAYYAQYGEYPDVATKAGVNMGKNPWGQTYSYTGGGTTYTLKANDGTNDRVTATGSNGQSNIAVTTP